MAGSSSGAARSPVCLRCRVKKSLKHRNVCCVQSETSMSYCARNRRTFPRESGLFCHAA